MSKNHPNDNMYSILGKLAALKPTPEQERFSLVKEIRESVEAQGSILTGVDAVQAKLAEDYASMGGIVGEKAVSKAQQKFMGMVHAAQKGEKPASKEVAKVAKDMPKKAAKDFAATKHKGLPAHVEEAGSVCAECGMTEGECEHTVAEAEITRKTGVTTHRKTDFPGYPSDDADDIEDTNKGKRGRPRKHAVKAATGLGRGRPKKAAAIGATAPKMHDPFGRVATGASKLKGTKGQVHSMDEAMSRLGQALTEGRYLEDAAGESLNHILNRFRSEVKAFEKGADLDQDLYDALYDYYVECGEMPYGVQKARDADPLNWVAERLDAELAGTPMAGQQEEDPLLTREAGIPGNVPAEQIPGKEDLLKGKGRSYYEEETEGTDSMEDELNELARLAGIQTSEGNAFTGKLAHTPKGGEFELDGKTFKDTSALGEEEDLADKDYDKDGEIESGKDEVIGSRRRAAGLDESTQFDGNESSDFNISTNMSSDGDKNVTVTATGEHAATLLQMLRIAGLGGGQAAQDIEAGQSDMRSVGITPGGIEEPEIEVVSIDEPECEMGEDAIPVDEPQQELQNAPKEKYGTIKAITTQGDDLNREKKQDPHTANKAANPFTNVATLEAKLAAEYDSIKKTSK